MMPLFVAGLLLGAVSSLHCVGMCGPIAISLPVVKDSYLSKFASSFLYNAGRITTYTILGAVLGTAAFGFAVLNAGRYLSIGIGILMLVFLFFPASKMLRNNYLASLFLTLRKNLGNLFARKNYHSVFFIGLLNGLLPCGLVYFALAAAVTAGSIFKSCLFMTGFGTGSLPVMWSLSFFGAVIRPQLGRRIKMLTPYFIFFTACLLIIRGLGLGIPYVSPTIFNEADSKTIIECHN